MSKKNNAHTLTKNSLLLKNANQHLTSACTDLLAGGGFEILLELSKCDAK